MTVNKDTEKSLIERRTNELMTPIGEALNNPYRERYSNYDEIVKELIQARQENILLEILMFSLDIESDLQLAKENNCLTFESIVQDLKILKEKKLSNHYEVRNNIGPLMSICNSKYGMDLSQIFRKIFENKTVTKLHLTTHDGEQFFASFLWFHDNGKLRNENLTIKGVNGDPSQNQTSINCLFSHTG